MILLPPVESSIIVHPESNITKAEYHTPQKARSKSRIVVHLQKQAEQLSYNCWYCSSPVSVVKELHHTNDSGLLRNYAGHINSGMVRELLGLTEAPKQNNYHTDRETA